MGPRGKPGLRGDVFEDDRAAFDKATSSDGAMLLIVDGRMGSAGVHATSGRRLAAFLRTILLRTGLSEAERWRSGENIAKSGGEEEPNHAESLLGA
jgi:hypothetical protein